MTVQDAEKAQSQVVEFSTGNSHTPTFDAVRQYLDSDGWIYSEQKRDGLFSFSATVGLASGEFSTFFDGNDGDERFGVYVYAPVKIPKKYRAAVAEFLTRVNYRLFLGKFEFDLDDGEVRMVTTVCMEGSPMSQAMIGRMDNVAHMSMNKYWPGMMAIVYSGASAESALATINAEVEEPE